VAEVLPVPAEIAPVELAPASAASTDVVAETSVADVVAVLRVPAAIPVAVAEARLTAVAPDGAPRPALVVGRSAVSSRSSRVAVSGVPPADPVPDPVAPVATDDAPPTVPLVPPRSAPRTPDAPAPPAPTGGGSLPLGSLHATLPTLPVQPALVDLVSTAPVRTLQDGQVAEPSSSPD
jgi:hypothetical protein